MTKAEAIIELNSGQRITHTNFDKSEWMEKGNKDTLVFEDGCVCSTRLFWWDRQSESWNNGYSIVEKVL